jgi:hypothetical protein
MEFSVDMVDGLRDAFYDFASKVKIDSKETGGETPFEPYTAQQIYFDGVFDGLKDDVHWFVILKARQLGVTTGSLILDLFWISYFPGCQGAIVTDTPANAVKLRLLLTRMINSLPKAYSIPIVSHNKDGLVLANGSSLDYISAGTRKNGGLGRSRAFNFLHATECSSWGDQEGLESLRKSLAAKWPSRLYVFESTARGFNLFHDMWEEAKEDELVKRAIFIGWWAKEDYSFDPKRSPKERELFERYGRSPASPEEEVLIEYVKDKYDFEVTAEQLAWYRHEKDPNADPETQLDIEEGGIIEQEMPWHEEQAFMSTGTHYFPPAFINAALKESFNHRFKGYRYYTGEDFFATTIEQVKVEKLAQLKVWEEPDPEGVYVIGADPAYGSSDKADRFCAQICRVYADGIDQVAEFCTTMIRPYQFAWIISHLCGAYANARLLMELNGPGEAVFTEFRHIQTLITSHQYKDRVEEMGLKNIFRNIRQYFYKRADSLGGGSAYHWKTTGNNKMVLYTQMRDNFVLGNLRVRSAECVREMSKIVQDGINIEGEGSSKDDRPMALCLALRAWIDGERNALIAQDRTRENEAKKHKMEHADLNRIFTTNLVADFFSRQASAQRAASLSHRRRR